MDSIHNAILRANPVDWILLLLFLFMFLLHVIYTICITLRTALHKNLPTGKNTPLSLMVVVKDEAENLTRNLKPFLQRQKGVYEVVAVDNFSQDETMPVLNGLKNEHSNFKISSLKQHNPYADKMAQNIALKAAEYEWVTLIPPSGEVTDTNWLHETSSRLNGRNQTLISYSNIQPERSFYNMLYRLEFFYQQVKSFGFITCGAPFVVSQENVAFRKKLYFDEGGFRGKISEPFANLELVINSFIGKGPVSLVLAKETSIYRHENVKWKDYLELVKKEVHIRKHLSAGLRILLVFYEWVSLLFVPAAALVVIRIPVTWLPVAAMVSVLACCNLLIIKRIISRLQEHKLFLPSFLIAFLLPFFKIGFRIRYFYYGRRKEWKIGN